MISLDFIIDISFSSINKLIISIKMFPNDKFLKTSTIIKKNMTSKVIDNSHRNKPTAISFEKHILHDNYQKQIPHRRSTSHASRQKSHKPTKLKILTKDNEEI